METKPWAIAIQYFKGGEWFPFGGSDRRSKGATLRKALAHIKWADAQWLDRRRIAVFSFAGTHFEEVPWS
ncbi:MAG: hypothetical protein WBQ86_09590 [Candidatus Binatus sp.]